MHSRPQLLDLPTELLAQILIALPPLDLYSSERVCHTFAALVRTAPITLARAAYEAGIRDNRHCSLSAKIRHSLLDARERAWRSLDTTRRVRVPVTFEEPLGEIYELKSGFFILSGRVADAERKHTVNYIDLHQVARNEGTSHGRPAWRTLGTPVEVLDVALCVEEHDLVAILFLDKTSAMGPQEVVLDIKQMSTGQPHPLSRSPILRIANVPLSQPRPQTNLEVVGQYVAVLVTFPTLQENEPLPDDCFCVYEWKTGIRVMQLIAPRRSYSSFAFLTCNTILFANQHDGSLEVYELPSSFSPSPLDTPPCPKIIRILGLPRLNGDRKYHTISCRSVPNPIGSRDRMYPQAPFELDPDASIVIISVCLRDGPLFLPGYSFIVHRAVFLSPLPISQPYHPRFNDTGTPLPFSTWEDWGPPCTRWFADDDSTDGWITTTAGARHVRLDSRGYLRLYDFGRARVKRALGLLMRTIDASEEEADANTAVGGPAPHHSHRKRHDSDDGHATLIALLRRRKLTWTLDENDFPSGVPVSGRVQPGETRLQIRRDAIWSSVFAADGRVQFELPCIETLSPGTFAFNVALMDNDRILGLHVDEDTQEVHTIDVFTISPP